MGKGWRKKIPEGMPVLLPVKIERRPGRPKTVAQDDTQTALEARCRQFGTPTTAEWRRWARAPHMGSPLGFVMEADCPKDVHSLWGCWQRWRGAEARYRLRIIGQPEGPKGGAFEMVPDKIETETGHTIDVRTPEEKDRDAVTGWMRWQGFLGQLPSGMAHMLHQAARGDVVMWRNFQPTAQGRHVVAVLRKLAEIAG